MERFNSQSATITQLEAAIDMKLQDPERLQPIVVSISGPSGSGKSTVVAELQQRYPASIVLSSDDYYLGLTRARHELPAELAGTFVSPKTMDLGKLATHLQMLKSGAIIRRPVYDIMTSEPQPHFEIVDPTGTELILFEGLVANLALFRALIDIRVCITADLEIRRGRRITRDAIRNGQTAEQISELFETTIEPAYEQFYRAADERANFIIDTSI